MASDVWCYVISYSLCATTKTPLCLPFGKLMPLPILEHLLSHLGVDFVTDLPSFEGNTVILVVVGWFYKSCHLISFPALPTAFQVADAHSHHVFHHYGLLEDFVLDRGPQFTS